MNSVAPATKRAAEAIVTRAGGRYVDVALMGPVEPARRGVPALVSGADAEAAAHLLRSLGFSQVRVIDGAVGRASTIKMLRSVIVKGIEALTAECFLAAREAGVEAEVAASLDAGWPGTDWRQLADYNLGRMRAHGTRRAAEMEEVAATLDSLGGGSEMARATALVQRRLAA
jgi:3-hydroxyisobutyrate dehydrogenase-like beta-hydroxyacid dehydrogenase